MAERDATARLRRAVKENNLFLVKRLIKRTDMRNPDPTHKRYTSLAWAAVLGHEETFEFLLTSGHDDLEISKDIDNNTILLLLADARPPFGSPYIGGPSDHDFMSAALRMARLYYDRYQDILILDWANSEGKTALHVAATKGNEELVRMLCDLGADYDLADNEGNTPLHYASAWGQIPVVQLLIERGCQYSARNNEGFTPSDYAYSTSTRDTLQDTARAQFEINKKARRNVFAQAAARGNEWGVASGQMPPPPPRAYFYANSTSRMRSGSGTSRTTNTSDSGDLVEGNYPGYSSRGHPSVTSSLSPSRVHNTLPQAYAPPQPSGSSTGSSNTFSATSPSSQPPSIPSSQIPSAHTDPAAALTPIATRTRQRDADAMEAYKLRQRSGSATTASTDTHSQNESNVSPNGVDHVTSLNSLVTVGSVAPRRRLRPSASAAQLRSTPQVPTIPNHSPSGQHDVLRNRSGTSPGTLKHIVPPPVSSSPPTDTAALSTPTQNSAPIRPVAVHTGSSRDSPKEKAYTGPPSEYAIFPPPPFSEEPERVPTSSTSTNATYSRRSPFHILSSHKNSMDQQAPSNTHKRNASVTLVTR